MARRNRSFEGTIALIPAGHGRSVMAKVLFVAQRERNLMLLGIYPLVYEGGDMPNELPESFADLLYTSLVLIKNGRWPVLGQEQVSSDESRLSERISAGNVWLGQELIRSATEADGGVIRDLAVLGADLVEKRAAAIADKFAST